MERLAVLYSGGKDSTLAARLLAPFYDLTLVTASFGVTGAHRHGVAAATALEYAHTVHRFDRGVAETAVDRLLEDGHPRGAIQSLHEHTLETVASTGSYDAIADGTRRDDRAPTVDRPMAQSLEDRHEVDYLAPLHGIGHGAVDYLTGMTFEVQTGPSESIPSADYERSLRTLLRDRGETVEEYFPAHDQSRVTGSR